MAKHPGLRTCHGNKQGLHRDKEPVWLARIEPSTGEGWQRTSADEVNDEENQPNIATESGWLFPFTTHLDHGVHHVRLFLTPQKPCPLPRRKRDQIMGCEKRWTVETAVIPGFANK